MVAPLFDAKNYRQANGALSLPLEVSPPRAGELSAQPTKGARLREKKVLNAAKRMRCQETIRFYRHNVRAHFHYHEKPSVSYNSLLFHLIRRGIKPRHLPLRGEGLKGSCATKISVLSGSGRMAPLHKGGNCSPLVCVEMYNLLRRGAKSRHLSHCKSPRGHPRGLL